MKNLTYQYSDIKKLTAFLSSGEIQIHSDNARSILVQVFISQNMMETYRDIYACIKERFPDAVVTGATTIGGIVDGKLKTGEIILNLSFFSKTCLFSIAKVFRDENEYAVGLELAKVIERTKDPIAAVLLFGTPLSNNLSETLQAMSLNDISYPVFGGGAAAYDLTSGPMIFSNGQMISNGIVMTLLLGDELQVFHASHLGWEKIGKERVVTKAHGKVVEKIDQFRAYDFYHHYLGIANDERFYFNTLEFPLLLEHNGFTLARVPFFIRDGAVEFCAEIHPSEHVTLGYGDPEAILARDNAIHKEIAAFAPEAIFLYSCVCRRFLLQDAIDIETIPFSKIASSAGFYTSGEFFSTTGNVELLNSAMVVVGMREEPVPRDAPIPANAARATEAHEAAATDPYINKHSRIISQLLHYINMQTLELEEANADLQRLAERDQLTRVHNRMKIDEILADAIQKGNNGQYQFSVIMIDVDNFKLVNDQYGHLAGDDTLIQLSNLFQHAVRQTDYVGRWGGEEFIIILPFSSINQALYLAERIRSAVAECVFPKVDHITCSFGVTTFKAGDTQKRLLQRADDALYWVKNNGRNQVNGIPV